MFRKFKGKIKKEKKSLHSIQCYEFVLVFCSTRIIVWVPVIVRNGNVFNIRKRKRKIAMKGEACMGISVWVIIILMVNDVRIISDYFVKLVQNKFE